MDQLAELEKQNPKQYKAVMVDTFYNFMLSQLSNTIQLPNNNESVKATAISLNCDNSLLAIGYTDSSIHIRNTSAVNKIEKTLYINEEKSTDISLLSFIPNSSQLIIQYPSLKDSNWSLAFSSINGQFTPKLNRTEATSHISFSTVDSTHCYLTNKHNLVPCNITPECIKASTPIMHTEQDMVQHGMSYMGDYLYKYDTNDQTHSIIFHHFNAQDIDNPQKHILTIQASSPIDYVAFCNNQPYVLIIAQQTNESVHMFSGATQQQIESKEAVKAHPRFENAIIWDLQKNIPLYTISLPTNKTVKSAALSEFFVAFVYNDGTLEIKLFNNDLTENLKKDVRSYPLLKELFYNIHWNKTTYHMTEAESTVYLHGTISETTKELLSYYCNEAQSVSTETKTNTKDKTKPHSTLSSEKNRWSFNITYLIPCVLLPALLGYFLWVKH